MIELTERGGYIGCRCRIELVDQEVSEGGGRPLICHGWIRVSGA